MQKPALSITAENDDTGHTVTIIGRKFRTVTCNLRPTRTGSSV